MCTLTLGLLPSMDGGLLSKGVHGLETIIDEQGHRMGAHGSCGDDGC